MQTVRKTRLCSDIQANRCSDEAAEAAAEGNGAGNNNGREHAAEPNNTHLFYNRFSVVNVRLKFKLRGSEAQSGPVFMIL
jgi:hypothetical protein